MSATDKRELIDELRDFINIYDKQGIKMIMGPKYSDEDLEEWYDPEIRQNFYESVLNEQTGGANDDEEELEEVDLGNSRASSPAKSTKSSSRASSPRKDGPSAQEMREKQEALAYELMEHDSKVEMLHRIVDKLESTKVTEKNLSECLATAAKLQKAIASSKTQGLSKESAALKPNRALTVSSTGKTVSYRKGCNDRKNKDECVIADERNPCSWNPENDPPCLTKTDLLKIMKKSGLVAPVKQVDAEPSVRVSSQKATTVPTGPGLTRASVKVSVAKPEPVAKKEQSQAISLRTADDMKNYIMNRVGTASKAKIAFNNYLREKYGPARTVSKLTVAQYGEVVRLTDEELEAILIQYSA